MSIFYTDQFQRAFYSLPRPIKQKFKKQARFLVNNLRHPSLRAKKYDEDRDIWQARVNGNYRFYFSIKGDMYVLLDIRSHPK